MQIFRLFFSLFLLFTLFGCEKELSSEEKAGEISNVLTDDIKNSALTVAQAVQTEGGTRVVVKGYIVAAAESSMKKADYHAPFEGGTAIVLADEPSDGTKEQAFSSLIPICLTDAAKGLRDTYNLEENPAHWNHFVYVSGMRKEYMSVPGIKKVENIWIDPNHQPETKETPDDPNDPDDDPDDDGSGDDDDDDGNGDDGGGNDNDDGNDGNGVLTVAQAIAADTYTLITVKGYIVATTSKSMKNVKFENINENYTAIVLADEEDTVTPELLFPVGLEKSIRDELSVLGDKLKNLRVTVIGDKESYLGVPGIKKAVSIEITP